MKCIIMIMLLTLATVVRGQEMCSCVINVSPNQETSCTASENQELKELVAEVNNLKESLNELKQQLISSEESPCRKYTFSFTSTPASFDQSQINCRNLGGNLIRDNLGESGRRYHEEIRRMLQGKGRNSLIWLGFTDREDEGTWKLLNGKVFNPNDLQQQNVYRWANGQPNDIYERSQDCAVYWAQQDAFADDPCTNSFLGLCEFIDYGEC